MMYKNRILILDDEDLTGQTIQSIAEFAGMQARYTTSHDEFFELVSSWQPGHIALDLIMPQMDGVEVMVELAKRNCRARIIVTSGVGNRILDAAARSAAEHGLRIAGILAKPFSPPRLRELLLDSPDIDQEYLPDDAAPLEKLLAVRHIDAESIRNGLEKQEFFLVYQPKVNCSTGVTCGFEALIRWQHPEQGLITPDGFIPQAEQLGLIDLVTEYVLDTALRWLLRLPDMLTKQNGAPYLPRRAENVTLSINISARSLSNLALFEKLNDICLQHGVAPERLIFELTETSAMEDPVTSLDILTRLRMKGFQLSIDDFGTGYSSMLQLARLPFSEIKVDKSFVMMAGESQESRTVIKSIIDLGHGLGLNATAEGIEDADTLDYLQEVGCDFAQGYHIARPMTGERIVDWLIKRSRNDEESRLSILHALKILDSPPEPRFDVLTRLAQRLFNVRICLFSLVDAERQWFKSSRGLDVEETPRSTSFCSHAICEENTLVVNNTLLDQRFADNPLVTGHPHIRFYAGSLVRASNSARLGTLCLIDDQPRSMTQMEIRLLEHLREVIEYELQADHSAANDPLTGLLNRHGFEVRAQLLLSICQSHDMEATLLFIDIDCFKRINQELGRSAGDNALEHFSQLLKNCLNEAELISRFGNDEFAILFIERSEESTNNAQATLTRRFAETREARDQGLSYSLGSSQLRLNAKDDLQQMLARADQAMQQQTRH